MSSAVGIRPSADARRARAAVTMLFVINAALLANTIPRLPEIKERLGLDNTWLGLAVAAMPVGSLLSGALAGWLINRFGSARVAIIAAMIGGLILWSFGVSPAWIALAASYFLLGLVDSLCDVAMNAHAMRVQRLHGRSIINGFHAWWSLGAVSGGAIGSLMAYLQVPLVLHLAVAGAVLTGCAIAASFWMLPGHDASERHDMAEHDRPRVRPVLGILAALGVITIGAAVVEDAPMTWGALFMQNVNGVGLGISGLAYVAGQTGMTIGRLVADRLVERFSTDQVARVGGLFAAVWFSLVLLFPSAPMTVIGFGLASFGVASIYPTAFTAAGNIPGLATGTGVAVVSFIARFGFL
ncbi:MAG: MFS transporter, partial [Propionibacteriales bacterium]|nr:MFS transporter [Propionibacteriales bacterium]